jgi:hypothetical protein
MEEHGKLTFEGILKTIPPFEGIHPANPPSKETSPCPPATAGQALQRGIQYRQNFGQIMK